MGIQKVDFMKLGMKPKDGLENSFNMGILALKIAGKRMELVSFMEQYQENYLVKYGLI